MRMQDKVTIQRTIPHTVQKNFDLVLALEIKYVSCDRFWDAEHVNGY